MSDKEPRINYGEAAEPDAPKSTFANIFREAFYDAFTSVYSGESYDIASETFHSRPRGHCYLQGYQSYRRNPLVMLTSFLGLSNYCEPNEKFTREKLKKNVFGSVSGFLKNLVSVIVTTPLSIAKLFTEFLPRFAAEAFGRLAVNCYERKGAFKILATLAAFACFLFHAVRLVGRAVTSPIESVRSAWFFCVPEGKPISLPRIMLGLAFATASILLTMTIYALLFSLIAPSLGLGAAQLAFMTPEASSAFAFIGSKIMLPMLLKAGAAISPVVAGFTTILGAGLGFVLGTVGPVVNDIYHWCQRKLRERGMPYKPQDIFGNTCDAQVRHSVEFNNTHAEAKTFHAEPGTPANSGLFSAETHLNPEEEASSELRSSLGVRK
jgi:hypothetical protein